MDGVAVRQIDASLNDLADGLEIVLDEVVDEIMQRVVEELPLVDERLRLQLDRAMRRSAYGNTRGSLQALRDRRHEPIETPSEALDEARAAARAGLALADLLTMYRLGHQVCLDRCLQIASVTCADSKLRAEVLRIASRFMFTYVDSVVSDVEEAFEREHEQFLRSSAQRKVQMVRDVLDGAYFGAAEFGYDLLGRHVGLVAEGPDAAIVLHRVAQDLAVRSFVVAATGEVAWAWLAADRFEPSDEPGLHMGIGDPLSGADGFRTTHRQAALACTVASRLDENACHYDDVTIEAAALNDEAGARYFVERELGALTGAGERNRRMRETLDCYLRTGQTAAAACAELCVTDRTVAYRLRTCEEILGRPVHLRAAELQVALRWGRVLGQFG
ncbi:hypothetical protein BKG60_23965 [Mycobacterium syngnathidarum]|nr:hypothetical protein BKG60_23965 [Mycobacterium syngnathidarum]